MLGGHFLPAGRNLTALGSTKRVTAYNCFVSGTIFDSLDSIMTRLGEAAKTMQMGGGIGYDFSTLRPKGDPVRSVQGRSSGPVSYIRMYDAMGQTISSAGERRGAQMGILRVDHPDIEEFIHAKTTPQALSCFNLSVAITNKFMEAVIFDQPFELEFEGRTYRTVKARDLWESIMRSTWDWAEPGVIFIDRINEFNNLAYCEVIAATNPCSEQPLPPYGACLLGSFNLISYLIPAPRPSLMAERWHFDWESLDAHIPVVVRAMDNIIDIALYPLLAQKEAAFATRRMGLGVTGLANCLEAQGLPYGSRDFISRMEDILDLIKTRAYSASADLAAQKGTFPLFEEEKYLESPFIKNLEPWVQEKIRRNGIRNSHLTSIAPTGTISFCLDNISSGIEPTFAPQMSRKVRGLGDVEVVDFGVANLGTSPVTADAVTPEQHIDVLCAAQRHIDSAVSKTCNVPSSTSWKSFKELYLLAWKHGAKGCATFQDGGKRTGVLSDANKREVRDCLEDKCTA